VTDAPGLLCLAVLLLPLLTAVAICLVRPPLVRDRINIAGAILTAGAALTLAALAMAGTRHPLLDGWLRLDALGGPFLAVIAVVGLCSALVSPAYLRTAHESLASADTERAWYYACFHLFWVALLALPLVDNLGVAWVIIAATTGVSALLVAQSRYPKALEAGWKYLVLTTVGLAVALFGIVVVSAAAPERGRLAGLSWQGLTASAAHMPHDAALVGFVLLVAGLATKIGWAPVHNWLPDAHSEAPPPVSALLSAALLPTVMLIAWRTKIALEPAVGARTGSMLFIGFGLASLAVSVPFLWRRMAWKRLLAYSSLENMGILALGIGFGGRLALAGVVLHVAAHAVAKSLGFSAATPLFAVRPSAKRTPVHGLLRSNPRLAGAMSLSLGALSGLPPSPLFFSEVLIVMGGFATGHTLAAALASLLLALGFLGLARVLVEDLMAQGPQRGESDGVGRRSMLTLTIAAGVLLGALTVLTAFLPGSELVRALVGPLP
jgi:hydrogenase-4 component F